MSKRPKKNGSHSAASGNGKRRQNLRAPQIVKLHLSSELQPNDRHPLAKLDPIVREAERQKLLAAILARIANGPIHETMPPGTIDEEPSPTTIAENLPKPE